MGLQAFMMFFYMSTTILTLTNPLTSKGETSNISQKNNRIISVKLSRYDGPSVTHESTPITTSGAEHVTLQKNISHIQV